MMRIFTFSRRRKSLIKLLTGSLLGVVALALVWTYIPGVVPTWGPKAPYDAQNVKFAENLIAQGREIYRYDTFGDEAFWGSTLQLHKAVAGEKYGGLGPGLTPKAAQSLGLKVDVEALPADVVKQIQQGKLNLDDPATTLYLLKNNAVLGVTGFFDQQGKLISMGIQCALCHSVVDNAIAPGIGHRLDGWANRDLNIGAIIALAPNLKPFTDLLGKDEATVRKVLNNWGPGKFDAELILDGKAFRPDGKSAATLLPPTFGLQGINLHTWTGWGSVPYWNSYVSNLLMMGKGRFYDPRLNNAEQFPIAAKAGFGNINNKPDLITAKLPALHLYQLSLQAPKPPANSYNLQAAQRGAVVFCGKGKCVTCHTPPLFQEPGWSMHTGEEIGIDNFQADRSPNHRYRTAPLKGLWTHQKGGFYHDGRFATLRDVVDHYNKVLGLSLTDQEKQDLVEYLKAI